jgi:hypothetical protein
LPSKTLAALDAVLLAADQANTSRAYPLDPTSSVFVSASQHLIIEVLRRPVEFSYNIYDHSAQWLDYETMTILGYTQFNEEFDHRNGPGTWYWDSGAGFIDWFEDLYYIDKKFTGPFKLVLTASNKNADLDLYVVSRDWTTIVGASNGASSDESVTTASLAAGKYYIAASYADDGGNYSTDYTLQVTR